MFLNNLALKVQLYKQPVDMRKSIDGLSVLVADSLSSDPCDGSIYVFYNKLFDKIKLLYWEKNGFCVLYKRLEKEKYKLPQIKDDIMELDLQQLRWLLEGLDMTRLQGFKSLKYSQYY